MTSQFDKSLMASNELCGEESHDHAEREGHGQKHEPTTTAPSG
jgi:hypothetical protein